MKIEIDEQEVELPIPDAGDISLAEAQRQMVDKMLDENGTACPCCGQHAQIYARPMDRALARTLLWAVHWFRANPSKTKIRLNAPKGSDIREDRLLGRLKYFGHLNQVINKKTDKPIRGLFEKAFSGKGTFVGEGYVTGKLRLCPKWAYTYLDTVLCLSRERVTFTEALADDKPFVFEEMMSRPFPFKSKKAKKSDDEGDEGDED